jgi:adhesin transport system membrane fusion protein
MLIDYKSKDDEFEASGSRRVIWGTPLILIVFFVWAGWAELTEVTRAPGTVIPSSRTQVVQTQDGGVLETMEVSEGDIVEPGQLLARIDRTRARANYLESRAKVAALRAKSARLSSEMEGAEPTFPALVAEYPDIRDNELILLEMRMGALNEEVHWLRVMKDLAEEELEMNRPLLISGDVSRSEVLRLQREVADLSSKISYREHGHLQEVQAELSETVQELEAVTQNLAQRKSILEQTSVYSPMRGIVKNVAITTIGGVYRAGDDVMEIVPLEDDLLVEAKVSSADIAFLVVGFPASVKIDAYDYTIYGDLNGTLEFISADTVTDDLKQNEKPYYRVRVRTSDRRFSNAPHQQLKIQPGMTAMVEIKTGERTVLEYFLKPVIKTLNESMGER